MVVSFQIGWHIQFPIGYLLVFLVEDKNLMMPYPDSVFGKSYRSLILLLIISFVCNGAGVSLVLP